MLDEASLYACEVVASCVGAAAKACVDTWCFVSERAPPGMESTKRSPPYTISPRSRWSLIKLMPASTELRTFSSSVKRT